MTAMLEIEEGDVDEAKAGVGAMPKNRFTVRFDHGYRKGTQLTIFLVPPAAIRPQRAAPA